VKALNARLKALENYRKSGGQKPLPQVVPDTTTDDELTQLRKHGREVFRESDLIDQFI
jgi:hypothetical protein